MEREENQSISSNDSEEPMKQGAGLDLIVPVYNERENIRPLHEEILQALGPRIEFTVYFVDDGSNDGSTKVLRELARDKDSVRVLHFERNRGQSAAFAAGFGSSSNSRVVTLDGDRQNDPVDILDLLETMEQTDTDAVLGYREQRSDGWKKRLGSYLANRIRNALLNEHVRDTGCSLKLFRREVVESFPYFEGMHRFFPSLIHAGGYSFRQIPTKHRSRPWGETKYSLAGRFRKVVLDLLGVAWLKARSINVRIDEVSE